MMTTTKNTPGQVSAQATLKAANALTRRTLLKSTAAGAALATAPLYVKDAFAADELNIWMWADYIPDEIRDEFKSETGITINFTGIGSNDELINKMKATKGRGADIASPTSRKALQWEPLEMLQPIDLSRVPTDKVNQVMLAVGEDHWNFDGKGSHWLPHIWGTEAIGWRTDKWNPSGGAPSYGDVWSDEVAGKMMVRVESVLTGAGLYMETIGELEPGAVLSAYKDEKTMRPILQKITDWCVARKSNVGKFWDDGDGQKNGFLQEGMVIGQVWDGPTLALKSEGKPVTYQAPVEGALSWIDGLTIPRAAQNIDEAYAFIDFSYRAQVGGDTANKTGYNSPVVGADTYLSKQSKTNFSEAYPGNSLDNLWPWPPDPTWYAQVRAEYMDRLSAA